MVDIYSFVLSKGILSEEHREELKIKRGFTDKTINKNKFISGGKYLLKIEAELLEKFKSEDLVKSGVCYNKKDDTHLSPILLQDKIIIPYLDKKGKPYMLRPHKLGLKNVNIEIYQELNIGKEIIITEGEFKAAAAQQIGFNAIAIPGIGSFSSFHFPRLLKFLNTNKVKEIAIMFDNEVKDDPTYPKRYKESPMDRYNTHFYSYLMASYLSREGFVCRIAWLPDGWMVDGKVDIDSALAQGKTKDDFKRVISAAKPHAKFLDELPSEIKNIVVKKIARKYFKSHIRKEFGKYIATRRRGKTEWDEIISNFTIKILATHETPDGIVRDIIFMNEFGKSTPVFSIPPESMSGSDGFSTFCLGRGNYVWRGNKEDLSNIWESEFLEDDGRHIIEPDHIGWIPSEKMWLFGNVALKGGKELRPDKSHIFWTEKKGIKPIPLGVTTGRMTISEGIPYLNLKEFDKHEMKSKLVDTIGEMEANICLGWIVAILFMEEIFAAYGCFPFLFVTGRRGSGKSTIAEWLMNFYGLENAGKMASDTTAVGIQRYLAYYSSLPVFLDEYRNTKQIMWKNGFLRNAYNRQSAGKGIKGDFGIREAKIRGSLIISGEETPEDNALLTRCVVVTIKQKQRGAVNHFNWFMKHRQGFSAHILDILRRREELLPQFMEVLTTGKKYFTSKDVDDRTALNYAIVAAGYAVSFKADISFAKWLATETQRVQSEYQGEQAVDAFLEDLLVYKSLGKIGKALWRVEGDRVFLYFHGLYTVWAQEYRKTRGIEPFKSSAIRDYLKEEPGFLEVNTVQRIDGQARKCISFSVSKAPQAIQQLVDIDV